MATPKIWTADDVAMRRLYLERQGSDILVQRDYVYIDDQDQPLPNFSLQVFTLAVPIASVPANVLNALQTIDNFIYNQILTSEGMT
jgi:hypothetical protein